MTPDEDFKTGAINLLEMTIRDIKQGNIDLLCVGAVYTDSAERAVACGVTGCAMSDEIQKLIEYMTKRLKPRRSDPSARELEMMEEEPRPRHPVGCGEEDDE